MASMTSDLSQDDTMQCQSSSMIFDIDFHPQRDFIAAGLVDGKVELWQHPTLSGGTSSSSSSSSSSSPDPSSTVSLLPRKVLTMQHHTKSCRSLCFDVNGAVLYTGSADLSVVAVDASGAVAWHANNAHDAPINCVKPGPSGTFFSGDDDGCLKVWDMRQQSSVM